jgi:hypothetical protein
MVGREGGEDVSFVLGAVVSLPFCQRFCMFSASGSDASSTVGATTTSSVLLALATAFALEHILSVAGITSVLKRGLKFDPATWQLTARSIMYNGLGDAAFFCFLAAGAY